MIIYFTIVSSTCLSAGFQERNPLIHSGFSVLISLIINRHMSAYQNRRNFSGLLVKTNGISWVSLTIPEESLGDKIYSTLSYSI